MGVPFVVADATTLTQAGYVGEDVEIGDSVQIYPQVYVGDHVKIGGGKIDYGETLLDAYRRELREETGLAVEHADWLCIQDCIESPEFLEPRHFLLINYVSRVPGRPEPRKNYESVEIGWFSPAAAAAMDLNQPTRAAIDLATRRGYLKAP